MAYFKETEAFDPEMLRILSEALDDAWHRVQAKSLECRRPRRPDRAGSAHFRYGQKGRA